MKTHKGGRERSGSFNYYHETNSYFCWGCKSGGKSAHSCHFIAAYEGISISNAATKILDIFKDDGGEIGEYTEAIDFDEQQTIMLDFSEAVRNFNQTYVDEKAKVYIEAACQKFDDLYARYKPDNQALLEIVSNLKKYILVYNDCI